MFRLGLALGLLATAPSLHAQNPDPTDALTAFRQAHGKDWRVAWNPATGTPRALFGPGLKLAGPVRDLAAARAVAQRLFRDHGALLGQGTSTFVETIGVKAGRVWILVFDQTFAGLPVISGRADVRIHDHGVVSLFGASAVRIPRDFDRRPTLDAPAARRAAHRDVLGDGQPDAAAPTRLVIWADTESPRPTRPVLAYEVALDDRPNSLRVGRAYVDARRGTLLAFRSDVHECACGTVHSAHSAHSAGRRARLAATLRARRAAPVAPPAAPPTALTGKVQAFVNRGHLPTAALTNVPLPNVKVTSSAGTAFTDQNGNFSIAYSGTTPVVVTATLTGRHTRRIRTVQGKQLTATATITPGTPKTLQFGSSSMHQYERAQTTTYWFTDDLLTWYHALMPGARSVLDTMNAIDPRVNIRSSCNAYYTNLTINFYHATTSCDNTAFETVIQHEWGHGLDDVFGGISQTDGLSEGWADTIALYRSRQHWIGPGFRKGRTTGIRTGTNSKRYPQSGSVHTQGQTWMGFNWDLRGFLIARHGTAKGEAIAHAIVLPSIAANARNQPDAVREVFLLDDDDGNLNNGTPNYLDLEKAAIKRGIPYPKGNLNAGKFEAYGAGCAGSGLKVTTCLTRNRMPRLTDSPASGNRFAIRIAPSTAARSIRGFAFRSRAVGTPQTIATQLFLAGTNGLPLTTPARTATMRIGTTEGWYRTTFVNPLVLPAGKVAYLSYTPVVNKMITPAAGSGTNTIFYVMTAGTNFWQGTYQAFWAFELHCANGTGAHPELTSNGSPDLGASFELNVGRARPNATTLLALGASNTQWGALKLPFDLSILGAKGCSLLSSGEAFLGGKTNAVGELSHTIALPNNSALFRVVFYSQAAVEDPTNGFGLSFTEGGKVTIGKR